VVSVQLAKNKDVRIAYETFGSANGEPLLLIMGLDFQMVWWPDAFCELLADRGFHVARFDNRDTGLSTHFTSPKPRNPFSVLLRGAPDPPYTTYDMVDDGIAVMDELGWTSAHLLGGSMGSALALGTAVLYPERVRTVTGVFTMPLRKIDALRYLRFGILMKMIRAGKQTQADPDERAVETLVEIFRMMSSPNHPFDEDWARSVAQISHSRAPRNLGTTQRQLAAGRAADKLTKRIGEVAVPTLLINGADDPFVRPGAAAVLAKQIRGARAEIYPRMGHTLPEHMWPKLVEAIVAHTARGGFPAKGKPPL
jgi:pimeloyl-ACP methyl ester carboxylesterase